MNTSQENNDVQGERSHQLKDSPLGRIPEDWDVVTVNEVAKITTGDKDTQDRDDAAPYPFFVRSQTVERIGSFSFDGEVVLTAGDGVGVGKVFHYYVGRFDFHQRVYCIHSFTKEMDGNFFFQYFRQNFMSRVTMFSAKGSVDSVRLAMISEMFLPQPLKAEQDKLAKILSTVDRAIEQTEALIAKQRRIKTGLMQDLLTWGIDEHGNLRSEQTHQFKDSPLGRIPVEWEVERWSQVCSKIQDGTHFSPRTDSSAEFKYVTSKNIKFGFLDLSDVEYIDKRQHDEIYKRCNVCFGDVLLTKDGANTGNAAINFLNEEFSTLSSVALIRPLEGKLTSMFLLQTILSESGQRLIKDAMSGLAITRVTLEIINNLLMKVPPVKEQKSIGQFLAVQDEGIKSEAKILAKLRSLKTALMQDLLTGKVRVTPILNESKEVNT